MVASVGGIPPNFNDITMKTSHINKVNSGSGGTFWGFSWVLLGGMTEEEDGRICAVDKE